MATDAGTVAGGGVFIGRDDEVRRIDGLLAAARNGRGGALVVTGEPGIGKSTLLDLTTSELAAMNRLKVDGYEAESAIPFAAIHRLLIPLRGFLPALPDRHQEALGVAAGLAAGAPPEKFLVGLGVLGLLAAAAEEEPLVCAVDDAHLLDSESLDVLAFVARRLEAESVALVLAGRSDSSLAAQSAGVPTLQLGGLPADAGVKLLVASLDREIDPVAAAQIVAATGGNPLALTDLASELTAKQLAESTFAIEPLPIGHHLESHYLRRVRQLSPAAQEWLVVAAADASGTIELTRAAGRDLGLPPGVDDEAELAGLVVLDDTVRFRHPLVRSAAYNAAHGPTRRRVHAALARAAEQQGLLELEAWHAARSTLGTDAEVADRLERVADLAGERGGLSSRARVLKEASTLTPPGPLRNARLVAAAEAALAAGAAQVAGGLLDDVDEDDLDPVSRGRLLATRADICLFVADPDLVRSGAELLRAAECFHGHDTDREQHALIRAFELVLPAERAFRGTTLAELGARMAAGAELRGGPASEVLRGLSALVTAPYAEAVPAMRRALAVFDDLSPDELLRYGASSVALTTALWDAEARLAWMVRTADAARDAGALQQLDTSLWILSLAEVHGGSPRRSASAMEQVRELRRANGYDAEHVINVSLLAWAGAPVAEVEAIAEGAAAMGFDGVRGAGQAALGVRDLSESRWDDAYRRLAPLVADPFLQVTPLNVPDFVEAAARSGHEAEAVEATAGLRAMAEANASPWNWGLVHRCEALLGAGDVEASFRLSIEALEQAVTTEVELARSRLLYGEWLRRNRRRRDAAVELRAALELFEQHDAPTFAARASAELGALGEPAAPGVDAADRARPEVDLTSQELLVARLAASGHTNAEIASTMFLSTNTIDYHLRKIFQKLGVSSRRQLRDHIDA